MKITKRPAPEELIGRVLVQMLEYPTWRSQLSRFNEYHLASARETRDRGHRAFCCRLILANRYVAAALNPESRP